MTYIVDLKTKFVPDNQRVFIVFPGEGYRFYRDMHDQACVFLDIPGFEIPSTLPTDSNELVRRLVMSERIKSWHLQGRPDDEIPVRDISQLGTIRKTERRIQMAGKIRNFYYDLRKGDIVIVPSKVYEESVLFGEILDEAPSKIQVSKYGDDYVPVRKVRWLNSIQRAKIPFWLERKIPSPNPVQQVEKSYFKDIFEMMYERYVFEDKFVCKYSISSEDFSSLDSYLFNQMLLYVTALYENNRGNIINNLSSKSIAVAASEIDFSQDIPEQRILIQSPGHIVLYARNLIPLVTAVFLMLPTPAAAADANSQALVPQVQIENSIDQGEASNACVAKVQQEVMDDLVAMGYVKWQELCEIKERAKERTGLNSGMVARENGRSN